MSLTFVVIVVVISPFQSTTKTTNTTKRKFTPQISVRSISNYNKLNATIENMDKRINLQPTTTRIIQPVQNFTTTILIV